MSAGVFVQRNEVGIRHTGVTVQVPNNDVARLMYYLNCVCTAVECEQDADIRRFTSYQNWSHLSTDGQAILLRLCYEFSPDVFDGKVFFHNDALCGDSLNDFIEISQVRQQLMAVESIIIAGRTCEVNKVMVYRMQWMQQNYFEPMKGLAVKLTTPAPRPVAYSPPSAPPRPTNYTPARSTNYRSSSLTPLLGRTYNRRDRSCCARRTCLFGIICGVGFILAFILAIFLYYSLRN